MEPVANYMASMGLGIASFASLAVGIPLWAVGSHRRNRIMETVARLPVPSLAVSPATSSYGLGLTWAF
jgi:hypothetical protein